MRETALLMPQSMYVGIHLLAICYPLLSTLNFFGEQILAQNWYFIDCNDGYHMGGQLCCILRRVVKWRNFSKYCPPSTTELSTIYSVDTFIQRGTF